MYQYVYVYISLLRWTILTILEINYIEYMKYISTMLARFYVFKHWFSNDHVACLSCVCFLASSCLQGARSYGHPREDTQLPFSMDAGFLCTKTFLHRYGARHYAVISGTRYDNPGVAIDHWHCHLYSEPITHVKWLTALMNKFSLTAWDLYPNILNRRLPVIVFGKNM